jgi:cell division GTPase FtsZ
MRPEANVIFGVRVDRKYDGTLRVLSIMTGVRSAFLESVAQQVSVDDVSSGAAHPLPLNPSSFLRRP